MIPELRNLLGDSWAIERGGLDFLRDLEAGAEIDVEAIGAFMHERERDARPRLEVRNGEAVIGVRGPIFARVPSFLAWLGIEAASYEGILEQLREADERDDVERIAFDIDSPGGLAVGCTECARAIAAATKPTVARTSGVMASAAYYLGAATDRIEATPSAQIGSIGTILTVYDETKLNERMGVTAHVITSAPYKAAGHPDKEFTSDDERVLQERVDDIAALFYGDVRSFRQLTDEQASAAFDGRVFIASKARDLGLIDDVRGHGTGTEPTSATPKQETTTMKDGKTTDPAESPKATEKAPEPQATESKTTEEPKATAPEAPVVDADKLTAEARAEGAKAERERIRGLEALRADFPSYAEAIDQFVADGTDVEAAERALFESLRKANKAELARARGEGGEPVGATPEDADAVGDPANLTEDDMRARFATDPEFRRRYAGNAAMALRWQRAELEAKREQRKSA